MELYVREQGVFQIECTITPTTQFVYMSFISLLAGEVLMECSSPC